MFVSFCLLISVMTSSCQVHWGNASNWTLYGYSGSGMFKLSVDSLHSLDTINLNQDSVTSYLSGAMILHSKEPVLWMGGYLATCNLDGSIRKVEFTNYGNFFYDEKTKDYYQVPADKAEIWLSYLQDNFLTLARRRASSK
jgi:hypothetical protein